MAVVPFPKPEVVVS